MKFTVIGYNSFKAVIDELGGSPAHVFYCQTGSNVFKALAVVGSDLVEGNLSTGGQTATNFTAEYSGAVEVAFDVKGAV